MSVYNIDENLTPVLLSAMCTCFMSHLLVLVVVLVSRELALVSFLVLALVLLQLLLTTTLVRWHPAVYTCKCADSV